MARTLLGDLNNAARALFNRSPVPYTASGNISIPWRQPTGAEAQMRAMGSVGTLFAIVNRTSNATALVNWRLYRKAPSGLKEDRVEVTQHAALDLINRPNPFFTRQELVESTQQHIDLTGEGWWVITRNPRSPIPLELWPVRPDRMAPIPDPVDFIRGYTYTAPDGREIPLRVEDVIQIRMPNPLDPYRGMGPVQSILTEIDASRYSAEWNRNFFLNSAEPGGILEVDRRLSDGEFNEARDRWSEQHRGVSNAHRVAIIENGLKWVDRKLTQRDMQFAELRQVSRDVMREAFGAPAFVLGEVGDVNRATAEASKVLFAEQLTVPRLERFKGALNNDLLPLYGKDAARLLEFDYDDPVPADATARNAELAAKSTAAKTLIDAGLDPAAVLEYLDLPQMAHTSPPAKQPPPAPAAVPAPAARVDLHHHIPYQLPARQPSYNHVQALPRRKVRAQAADDAALEQIREQFDIALASLLDAWEPVAEAQLEEVTAQIETAVNAGDTAALADLSVDSDAAAKVLRSALADMAKQAAAQMAAEAAEQGVKVKPPRLARSLTNAFGSELVEVAAAVAGLLSADVAASAGREALRLLVPGADGTDVAGKVGTFLRGLKNWFRRDHLGGALHRAQNIGRLATLAAAPPARYRADERMDQNTCSPCREIDGTEWDTLAEAQAVYGAGGYLRCEGGIRCRGTVTAFWDTTEEASMGRTRRAWNTASPEQIAARSRAMRPELAPPDGTQSWYRITNAMDGPEGPGTPCLYIYGDIGSWGITAAQCVHDLAEIEAPVIDLYINSPGGEVFDGLAIYNALRSHPAKVMVRVDALAASIASVIAMAGDHVTMSPGSQMMIHDANGVACGEPDELRKYADFLDAQSDNIAAIYAERAGGTAKQWRARMQAETWYFADEAVAAGLADEVAKPVRQDTTAEAAAMAASWDLAVYNYAHTSRDEAPAPVLDSACPTHHTATVDSPWDAGPNEKRLPSPMPLATAKKAYGWYDPAQVDNGELPKTACKFPHHEVSGDGTPGAANLAACRNGLARLPQSDVPEAQRAAVERHLRAHLADGGSSGNHTDADPMAVAFDPAAFRAAAVAALDPMPDYQPDHLRSLMAGLAGDAPAVPAPQRVEAPYVPPPVDQAPEADPEQVAVGWFRSLFTAVANDAPAAPPPAAPAPAAEAPPTMYVPEPPRPADEVAVDYMRTLMANAAQDLAAPDQAAAPGPAPADPVPAIDRTAFERSLREARL
ncbi:head maturation protease, ClpP-related [Streptomyces sp. YIM S03343]